MRSSRRIGRALDRTHPLAEMLSTLRRERGITRLVLRGLDITHVSALVDSIVGPNAPSQLPRMILDSTDGNPFFVTDAASARDEGHCQGWRVVRKYLDVSDLGLSEGIKEVVGRRLSRLSETCNRMLGVASIVGREFDAFSSK